MAGSAVGDQAGLAPMSHTFLQEGQCEGLLCDACCSTIAAWAPTVSYRALPSEHWEELIEAWVCHADQRLHDSISKGREAVQRSGTDSKSEEVWVGDFHYAVSWSKVSGVEIKPETSLTSMETLDAPRVIVCRQCGHRLGHEVRTEHGQVASGAAVRFFKYATRPSLPNLTLPSSIFVMVANQMTHLADVYGVRHFELVDDSTGTRQAQLWLFTPRVKMSIQPRTLWPRQIWQHTTWPQQNSDETDAFILPAAKIFYQINGTEVESAPLQAQGSMRVERLEYPAAVCTKLLERLRLSNESYPASRRKFGPWSIGWLER